MTLTELYLRKTAAHYSAQDTMAKQDLNDNTYYIHKPKGVPGQKIYLQSTQKPVESRNENDRIHNNNTVGN